MQLADIQRGTISKEKLIESVYMLIKNDYGGRATTKHIEKEMDDMGKRKIGYAIRRLIQEGKIKRVRGFGPKGIQYYYEIL
jgi:hypothetical protein